MWSSTISCQRRLAGRKMETHHMLISAPNPVPLVLSPPIPLMHMSLRRKSKKNQKAYMLPGGQIHKAIAIITQKLSWPSPEPRIPIWCPLLNSGNASLKWHVWCCLLNAFCALVKNTKSRSPGRSKLCLGQFCNWQIVELQLSSNSNNFKASELLVYDQDHKGSCVTVRMAVEEIRDI